MGNRACVVFTNLDNTEISPAVYLHWNGGPESIYAFLDELERRNVSGVDYAAARFTHIVGDFFDMDEAGSLSLGILNSPAEISGEALRRFAGMADDNGVFVVHLGKKRTIRRFVLGVDEVRELTRREVEQERKAAYKHAYHKGNEQGDTIAGTFLRIRPRISRTG